MPARIVAAMALLAALLPLSPRVEWREVAETRMQRFDHALATAEPYTSPPIPLGLEATSLGAHWLQTRAPDGLGATVMLRASEDGLAWGEWHAVEGEAARPEGDAERVLGVPAVGLGGRFAQYRVQPAAGAAVQGVSLFALDSASRRRLEPRPALGPRTAAATIKPLGIVGRAQWGADESIRFERSADGGATKLWPEEVTRVEKIVVHHTAGPNVCASPEPWCQRRSVIAINDIYHFHTVGNGWGDIGYNALVGYDGRIYEGATGPSRSARASRSSRRSSARTRSATTPAATASR
jgi:hypothetical protein